MCGQLKIRLSRLPGHGWKMSIPDEDYWHAALPLPRDADQDEALANVQRRFPDALIEIPGNEHPVAAMRAEHLAGCYPLWTCPVAPLMRIPVARTL